MVVPTNTDVSACMLVVARHVAKSVNEKKAQATDNCSSLTGDFVGTINTVGASVGVLDGRSEMGDLVADTFGKVVGPLLEDVVVDRLLVPQFPVPQ